MSTITSLAALDSGATSRTTINTNFTNLNADKVEAASPTFTGTATFASLTASGTVQTATLTATSTTTLATSLTGLLVGTSGVVSATSDATSYVSASSLTLAGKVELATTAEINTGTDSTRAIPVDQFVASNRNIRYILFKVLGETSDWPANGTTTVGGDLEIPFTGTITEIGGYADTAGTTGTAIVDVNLNGSTLMTTNKLSWDTTEKSTRTAATAPTLTTTAVTAGDLITVDVDTNHTTKSKGLTIRLGIRYT